MRKQGTEGGRVVQSRYLQPIPRTKLTEEIVRRIVNLILEEGLRPGDKLPSERELIAQLSVGRSSLREALKILSATGLVQVVLGEGMFVGRGDLSLIARPLVLGLMMGVRSRNELIETRRVLEVELAGFAAERATPEEIDVVRNRLQVMKASQNDPERYSQADLEFHLAIAKAAHNDLLYNLLTTLREILGALIRTAVVKFDANRMPQSFKVHVPIYDAIRARNPKAARTSMMAHLGRLEERLGEAAASTLQLRPRSRVRIPKSAALRTGA